MSEVDGSKSNVSGNGSMSEYPVPVAENGAEEKDGEVTKSEGTKNQTLTSDLLQSTNKNLDWVLTNYDQKNSDPQSLEEELKRLQALRSYLLLDSEREEQFERLTALASRVMDVPIALVSLVDLGRQWFMSNRGLGDVRETPRSSAFCSHAILSKDEVLIIKDAKKDPRFVRNPLVTGPPFIRFYAGAPLETPEGYKLGTFCIIDTKPWPEGLDLDGKQNLREFAGLAVEVMISRKRRREREMEENSQQIACAAHDLLTPLSGIELSMHLLKEDEDFQSKLSQSHKARMKKVETCSGIIEDICNSVRSSYAETKSSFEQSLATANLERVNIASLIEKLSVTIESLPTKVPITITVDPKVPKEIISDSSKLFRGAINYLVIASKRTVKGKVVLTISMKPKTEGGKKSVLVVKCEDTAAPVDLNVYEHLFKPPSKETCLFDESSKNQKAEQNLDLCLFTVACEMNVIGGEFGFRPRSGEDKGCESYDKEIGSISGSVFWFSVPCIELEDGAETMPEDKQNNLKQHAIVLGKGVGNGDESMATTDGAVFSEESIRKKRALIIEDSTIIRAMLSKILMKLGFEVSEAENGMIGLEKLKSSLFDITLLDFLMPIMDGLDCLQQYRDWEKHHRPWITQRIVGISAHATKEDVERGLKIGMNDYKSKPIGLKVLSSLIECDQQQDISRRLDELERREAMVRNETKTAVGAVGHGGNDETKEAKEKHVIDGRACTLLMISPRSEEEHTKQMQTVIKHSGWQTTTASTEREALVWLKMRTWDLVLVDETLSPVISDFRAWESKKRQNRQERIILMTENANELNRAGVEPPKGLDSMVGKPMGLHAVDNLLESTYLLLSGKTGEKAS